jgi:hypothetical protein
MKKIDIWIIVSDHLRTLRDARNGSTNYCDIVIFFAIPSILAVMAFGAGLSLAADYWSLSVTFFGIFIALLLNMQVAVFGIHQKGTIRKAAFELTEAGENEERLKRTLIAELNASLSYLTLVSTISLIISFCAFIWKTNQGLMVSVSIFFSAHFALTLLMVLKRSHILFKREFS